MVLGAVLRPVARAADISPVAPLGSGLPPIEVAPEARGQAVPKLPELPLRPAPSPEFPLPPVPAPTAPRLKKAPLFVLRGVKIVGNTVIDAKSIDAVVAPYVGKPVSAADLEEIRRRFTLLFIKRGFINSGAVIPNQKVENGIVAFNFVEGRITGIEVEGTKHFSPEFFRARLERAGSQVPFNVADMEREQQILLEDPLIRRLNLELLPGLEPGEAHLDAKVLEGSPYSLGLSIADDQSPTVGEVRGELHGAVANLLGYGDILAAEYGRSQGIDDGYVAYSVPILPDDTRVSLRYDRNGTLVIAPTISPLNITSEYSSIAAGISRPFYRTETQNLTLGLDLERRRAQSFIFGNIPFSFAAGAVNGNTNVTALRFYQAWLDRDANHAFAARSTMSFGLPIVGATEPPSGAAMPPGTPSGTFFSWLGQTQYVRRIFKDWEAVVRGDLQLTADPLFPIEQFALGGLGTVRGYRTYLTVTDDALLASGELRIPIAKLRIPRLARADADGTLQLVPFYDYGRGWNVGRATPYPPDISSVGLGLRWLVGSGITAEFYYAKGLRKVSVGTSLEDRGILFRVSADILTF
ncbi:MAG TPA: ShlB/FhaC/HecB family hemolysin secretion/activation protein [Stellaceae bacterium]|nr:ShlB/FhaC/HecB family hemolysin secretion/activation protein [Stellaceae bacterium]